MSRSLTNSLTVSLCTALMCGWISGQPAHAQSGFGSDDVSASSDAAGDDVFDLSGLEPEDQTPTGKFTTAAEISPIMQATKDSWAAVREYEGQDWVYFSHILAWRCGLKAMKYSINEGPLQDLQLPECHMKYKQPNALIDNEVLVGVHTFDLGSVESIRVVLLLDNLTTQSATLRRENILIP